jgi:hypothetical protein
MTNDALQPNSTKDQKGTRNLNNSLLFLDLFLYLSFFSAVGKEARRWWEIV